MDEQELLTRATNCLEDGDVDGLRALVGAHPQLISLRSDNAEGLTLLHIAARNGDCDLVRTLIEIGADPADRAGQWVEDEVPEGGYYDPGWTAMMLAARGGHSHVVSLLIDYGTAIGDLGQHGDTALLFAVVAGSIKTLELLIAHGAATAVECDVKQFNEELGWHTVGTPMHAAAYSGRTEVIRCLLGHGAAVDPCLCPCGRSPLFYAAARGKAQAVGVLLHAGANPNRRETRDVYGSSCDFTPLHYAAKNGHAEVVRLLLDGGADRSAIVTYSGQSAEKLAMIAGHDEVLTLLRGGKRIANPRGKHLMSLNRDLADIQSNLDYIDNELESLFLPKDVKQIVLSVTQTIGGVLLEVESEVRLLENIGLHPHNDRTACDVGESNLTRGTRAIRQSLERQILPLDEVVRKLNSLADADSTTYGGVMILVSESAANILRVFVRIWDVLDVIAAVDGTNQNTASSLET